MNQKKFLFRFAYEHVDFCIPEIKAVAAIFGFDVTFSDDHDIKSPYLKVFLPSEQCVHQIMSRTVTVRSAYELWAEGRTMGSVCEQLQDLPGDFARHIAKPDISYRMLVDTFNKQLTLKDRISRIEKITDILPLDGVMDLSDYSNVTLCLMEYYGKQGAVPPEEPELMYFGRWVSDGQRDSVGKYSLQKRTFIGNTSMDPLLSLIMSNMAGIKPGDLVFDPFVGTGSLLIACAHHGAHVCGTDIDYNLLLAVGKSSRAGQKWRKRSETIYSNLQQYGLSDRYIDVVVADAAQGGHMWRPHAIFDAIVADPPYGIREPTRKLGSKKNDIEDSSTHDDHIPAKTAYNLSDILLDLMSFAGQFLCLNGHLVFWIPVCRQDYEAANIPKHDCFELVANCEQILNSRISRRLVTMKKIKELDDVKVASVDVDHYAVSSFRDRYFKPTSKVKRTDEC